MSWAKERYPEDWREIAGKIKRATGWRCEACGSAHAPELGKTLTVHHLNGNPQDNRNSNLVALCQRCHLSAQNSLPRRRDLVKLPAWIYKQLTFPFAPAWLRHKIKQQQCEDVADWLRQNVLCVKGARMVVVGMLAMFYGYLIFLMVR